MTCTIVTNLSGDAGMRRPVPVISKVTCSPRRGSPPIASRTQRRASSCVTRTAFHHSHDYAAFFSVARATISCCCRGEKVGGRPARGRSRKPWVPSCSWRFRQHMRVPTEVPRRRLISRCGSPSAQRRTMRARKSRRWANVRWRTIASSVSRSPQCNGNGKEQSGIEIWKQGGLVMPCAPAPPLPLSNQPM